MAHFGKFSIVFDNYFCSFRQFSVDFGIYRSVFSKFLVDFSSFRYVFGRAGLTARLTRLQPRAADF